MNKVNKVANMSIYNILISLPRRNSLQSFSHRLKSLWHNVLFLQFFLLKLFTASSPVACATVKTVLARGAGCHGKERKRYQLPLSCWQSSNRANKESLRRRQSYLYKVHWFLTKKKQRSKSTHFLFVSQMR